MAEEIITISKKKVTVTLELNDSVAQNDFKNWIKSCPFSPEGGQTLVWEYLKETKTVEVSEDENGNPVETVGNVSAEQCSEEEIIPA